MNKTAKSWRPQAGNRTFRAYKVELDPGKGQVSDFMRYADVARWTWNYAVARHKEICQWNRLPTVHMKYPNGQALHKEIVRLKHTTHPWLASVSKCVPQEALRDFDQAIRRMLDSRFGHPKFKSKKWAKRSFTLTYIDPNHPQIHVEERRIKLPTLGWIRLKEHGYIPTAGARTINATVSETAGRWFVSVQVADRVRPRPLPRDPEIFGVDVGVMRGNLLVVSNAEGDKVRVFTSPRALRTNERRLKRLQRSVSRKQKGSSNRGRAVRRLERLHFRIANVRKDALHKATTQLAKNKSIFVVENLAVRAMMGNHRLAKSLADASISEAVRQLRYKGTWYGSGVIEANRSYPSSQLCSGCGKKHPQMRALDLRVLRCQCGLVLGRDLNAARNLARWPTVSRTLETPVRAERLQAVESPLVIGDEAGKNLPTRGRLL